MEQPPASRPCVARRAPPCARVTLCTMGSPPSLSRALPGRRVARAAGSFWSDGQYKLMKESDAREYIESAS